MAAAITNAVFQTTHQTDPDTGDLLIRIPHDIATKFAAGVMVGSTADDASRNGPDILGKAVRSVAALGLQLTQWLKERATETTTTPSGDNFQCLT